MEGVLGDGRKKDRQFLAPRQIRAAPIRGQNRSLGYDNLASLALSFTIQTRLSLFQSDRLAGKQLRHRLQRVNLGCRLVPANANNSGKAQRIPAFVPA